MLNEAGSRIDKDLRMRLSEFETLKLRTDPVAVTALLKDKADVIATLVAVADSPPARFGLKYEDGYSARLPEILPTLPAFHALLNIDARALAQAGRPDSAMRVLRAAVRMADIMGEPCLIHLLASVVGFDSTCALIGRIAPSASPASRALVMKELWRLDFRALLVRAVASEIVLTEATVARQGPVSGEDGRVSPIPFMKIAPLRNGARAIALGIAGRSLTAAALPWYEGHTETERIEKVCSGSSLYSEVAKIATPNVNLFYTRIERLVARRDMTVLGLGALNFRSVTGRLPATVNEVYDNEPSDPFTGKPYNYRADGRGVTIYSVGSDGTNDSGDAAKDLVLRVSI
jgi:hypothetical protein